VSEQLSFEDARPHVAGELPPVMRWRKLLVRSVPGECPVSTSAFRGVGAVLANHADRQGGSCFPSIETIAAEAGVSRRTALYATAALEEAGLLYRRRRRRSSTSYVLVLPVEKPVQKVPSESLEVQAEAS